MKQDLNRAGSPKPVRRTAARSFSLATKQRRFQEVEERLWGGGCIIDDGRADGEVTFHIDNEELSLDELGRLLRSMPIGAWVAFVRKEFITEPKGRNQRAQEARSMKRLPGPIGMGAAAYLAQEAQSEPGRKA